MIAEPLSRPILTQVESSADSLVVVAEFPGHHPDQLFAYWTVPALLCRWWPQWAATEPRPGGAYHLAWPAMNWHLRGHYTVFRPGRGLFFTWQWDHELSDTSLRRVQVIFRPLSSGTRLTLIHDPYYPGEAEEETRMHHLDGWHHFLRRLQDQPPSP